MKKPLTVTILAMVTAFTLCLVGCGGNTSANSSNSGTTSSEATSSEQSKVETVEYSTVGDTVVGDDYECTIVSAEWMDEVNPDGAEYTVYLNKNNYSYYVVTVQYKNIGSSAIVPHFQTTPYFTFNDHYKIDGEVGILEMKADGSQPLSVIQGAKVNPLETSTIYLIASVSNEMKEKSQTVTVDWKYECDEEASNIFMPTKTPYIILNAKF